MEGASLHTLGLSGMGLASEDAAVSKKRTRKDMVANILAVQQRYQVSKSSIHGASANNCRAVPTPVRQSGPCPECGWLARGFPKRLALCTCGFIEMDPFRRVESVIALVHLQVNPHSSIEVASMQFNCGEVQEASVCLELRMARIGEPRKHIWPYSMVVSVDNCEVFIVHPPLDGKVRHDAPLQLQCPRPADSHILEIKAHQKHGHKHSEFVCCLVRVSSASSISDLVQTCVSGPSIAYQETLASWTHLRDQANSAVECSSPWVHPLQCPLTRERMRIPARGKKCEHITCFDLEAYLTTVARASFHRRWYCPVCGCPLPFAELLICDFTKHWLSQAAPDITGLPMESVCNYMYKAPAVVSQTKPSSTQAQVAVSNSSSLEITSNRKRVWKQGTLAQSQDAANEDSKRSWGRRVKPNAGRQGALDL
mmetsp:Transcript_116244/g.183766  ORF Transcript_116244/g.183766 Transcript_116244/m.183766 type:complete len:425 (+) Transcript_116244:53-1327(+)